MHSKANYLSQDVLAEQIAVARGEKSASCVLKNVEFLDVFRGEFVRGDVAIHNGFIVGTCESYTGLQEIDGTGKFLVPGFIDSHVHIESSLMTPASFQEAVLPLGTTTAIWDPHEIANVMGQEGISWALTASQQLLLDIFVMLPSCVPSTSIALGLESSGALLNSAELAPFKSHPRVLGLAEMMNYPGLLHGDPEVLSKLTMFQQQKRDGHCPGLSGKDLNAYGVAGIHSCHESTSYSEAAEKLQKGIQVLIREGSCAKNAETLLPLVDAYSSSVIALCSDDRNPADIYSEGHINAILNKGLELGKRPVDLFRTASFAAAKAYGLEDRGAIAPGFLADLCLIKLVKAEDWQAGFTIDRVFKKGVVVDQQHLLVNSQLQAAAVAKAPPFTRQKNMNLQAISTAQLRLKADAAKSFTPTQQRLRVIKVLANQIVTELMETELSVEQGLIMTSSQEDILKIAVFERHHNTGKHAVALVHGFALQEGAIATSINHDSHNVIAVGASDEAIVAAVNRLIAIDGGIVVWRNSTEFSELPLPIAGLMSHESPQAIHESLIQLKALARKLGCPLHEPFLQLSFLALPVIPKLKITDCGLVDVEKFQIVPLACPANAYV